MERAVAVAWMSIVCFALGCGAGYQGRCYATSDCAGDLMCNGDHPLGPPGSCRSDDDCATSDGTRAHCASRVMNGVPSEGVCVHAGQCVTPEQMRP